MTQAASTVYVTVCILKESLEGESLSQAPLGTVDNKIP